MRISDCGFNHQSRERQRPASAVGRQESVGRVKSPKSKVQMEKRCNSRITDHESRVTRKLGGRTNPFRRKPKATKGKGRMLRHVTDQFLRSGADLLSRCGSSRPAMTARAAVTIKEAYADGLRPERH